MIDARQYGKRAVQGRIVVTENHQQLLEEGNVSRIEKCRIFRGDLRSLVLSSLRILGSEDEDPGVVQGDVLLSEAAEKLEAAGVSARLGEGDSLEDIAIAIAQDAAVVLAVNAGELLGIPAFFDCGNRNQLVMPAYSYRDPDSLRLVGFRILYPAAEPQREAHFVAAETLRRAWLDTGGCMLISENPDFFKTLS